LLPMTVTKAREVRHVQTERRPKSDHRGERWNEDFPEFTDGVELALLRQQIAESMRFPNRPSEQQRGHDQDKRRSPVLNFAQQIHAAIDDVDIHSPKQQERNPLSRHVTAEWSAEQTTPIRNGCSEERVKR